MPRFSGRTLVPYACWFFLALAGFSAPVFASDAAKAPPPKEKEPNYADEEGAKGRSGAVYKRVLKEARGEPEPVVKEEPKPVEAKKTPRTRMARQMTTAKKRMTTPRKKKKNTMTGTAPPPKKKRRKTPRKMMDTAVAMAGDMEHPKRVEPTVSTLYDPAVIKLDGNNRPLTPIVQKTRMQIIFVP